eukprot:6077461-Amphidinium_carterae.1
MMLFLAKFEVSAGFHTFHNTFAVPRQALAKGVGAAPLVKAGLAGSIPKQPFIAVGKVNVWIMIIARMPKRALPARGLNLCAVAAVDLRSTPKPDGPFF